MLDKSGENVFAPGYDRLALSFKAMGGGLWDYDIQADSLYCNDRWYEIMGLSRESTPITQIAQLGHHVHKEDVEAATAVDLQLVEGLLARDERYHVEFRIIRPNGDTRWMRSVACIIRDETQHLRAVGCITDITEFRVLGVEPKRWTNDAHAAPDGTCAPPSPSTLLTDRERECLLWVSMGKTAWETASILDRSQRTVEFHL